MLQYKEKARLSCRCKGEHMGRFSVTIQIRNSAGREDFLSSFCGAMKKSGCEPCGEDEAALSYMLGFSDNWVTLALSEYAGNPDKADKDALLIAHELKTAVFSVEVVDSDFAVIELFGENTDKVIVGDGSGYGVTCGSKGGRECWELLLTEGCTWEQLSAIWAKDGVCVEDALCGSAPLLGIEPEYMTADYNELCYKARDDKNITALYFKKAKSMSLNTAFKKVFGEALEPIGFKLIKSKYPYFVRVVPGGEIIHVITLLNEPSYQRGKKCFKIFGGIATVYRDEIDLTQNPGVENINWMRSNARIAIVTDTKYDFAYKGGFQEFLFETDNESEMLYELQHSLDVTKKIMLPIISKAVDIYSSIECFFQIGMPLRFGERFECLLFLKTPKYADIFINRLQKRDDEYKEKMEHHVEGYTPEGYETELRKSKEVIQREVSPIDEVFADPDLLAEYTAKLERRKAVNVEKLRSYGLDL